MLITTREGIQVRPRLDRTAAPFVHLRIGRRQRNMPMARTRPAKAEAAGV
jgi:hypothetical protein